MAKFKPAKGKKPSALPNRGLPCVILLIVAMALLLLFVFFVMKYANG